MKLSFKIENNFFLNITITNNIPFYQTALKGILKNKQTKIQQHVFVFIVLILTYIH